MPAPSAKNRLSAIADIAMATKHAASAAHWRTQIGIDPRAEAGLSDARRCAAVALRSAFRLLGGTAEERSRNCPTSPVCGCLVSKMADVASGKRSEDRQTEVDYWRNLRTSLHYYAQSFE